MREFDTRKPLPVPDVFIHLGLTSRCASRCIKCNVWRHSPSADPLQTRDWQDIIGQLDAAFSNTQITLSGGEPLMNKGIYDLIRTAAATRLRAVLNTSGHMITPRIAGKLVEAGCRYVYFSLDGLEKTADAVKGLDGAFRRTVRAVDLIHREDPGVVIGLVFVMMSPNMGEVLPFLEHFAADERIAEIRYQPVFQPAGEDADPHWWNQSGLWPDNGQVDEVIDEMIRMKLDGYPVSNTVTSLNLIRGYFSDPEALWDGTCPVGKSIFVINPEGMVQFCLEMEPAGNATRNRISDILRSPKASKSLENIANCRRRYCHLPVLGAG